MAKRYLIVSDLHLSDIEDHADGWKAYKSSRYVIDEPFAELLRDFCARAGAHSGEPLTLILNGDIFDFDLVCCVPQDPPWPVSRFERGRGLDPTPEKSAWKLRVILAQHPVFIAALAEFLAAGNEIVYVLGNHDREFHFAEVQAELVSALWACAQRMGARLAPAPVRFEPWFYYVPGELYVEHGNQFDHYSSFRDLLEPTVDTKSGPQLAVPMGNLSNRYLGTRMGFFNPHATDFILNLFRYAEHWFRHYAFSRRSIIVNWFVGSLLVIAKLIDTKRRQLLSLGRDRAALAAIAQRFGLSLGTVFALKRLQRPPIANRLYLVVREFWIDRLLLAVLMVLGTVALALLPVPLWAKITVPFMGFPLVYSIYEWAAQGESALAVEQQLPKFARAIAELLPVRVVTFGHTHRPRTIPLAKQTSFVDTGAWAPMTVRLDSSRVSPGFRNYLELELDGDDVKLSLDSWTTRFDVALLAQPASNEDPECSDNVDSGQRALG